MNFIRRLRIAWIFSRNFPYTELDADYWLMEDAKTLSNFLTSSTGTKLRFILRNKVSDSANRAVIDTSQRSQHLCGFAAGVRSTVAEIDSLLDLARIRESLISLSDEELKDLADRANIS